MIRLLAAMLWLQVAGSSGGGLVDQAPPPPPPEPSLGETLTRSGAKVVRPFLPPRYANVNDAQAVALGALGLGILLVIGIATWGGFVVVRRLPALLTQHRDKRAAARRAKLDALLWCVDATPNGIPSLHESIVVGGLDDLALQGIEAAAKIEEESFKKFPGWPIVLKAPGDAGAEALLRLRRRFMWEQIKDRALAACMAHPLLGRKGLTVELMPTDDPWDLEFSFVRADGLGATLEESQRAAHRRLQSVIEKARVHLDNPYALGTFKKELLSAGTTALPGTDIDERIDGLPVLAVILFGETAFSHAGNFFTGENHRVELNEALARHLEVIGEPADGEGVAALIAQHARAREVPGIGALIAAIGGAALKAPAASLKLRQLLATELSDFTKPGPASDLGEILARTFQDIVKSTHLIPGARILCGVPSLMRARDRVLELRQDQGRDLEADLLAPKWTLPSLRLATIEQHFRRVDAALNAALSASDRLLELLKALSTAELASPFRSQALLGVAAAALNSGPMIALLGPEALTLQMQTRDSLLNRLKK